jgi:hypothetical protein
LPTIDEFKFDPRNDFSEELPMSTSSEDKSLPEAAPNEPLPDESGGFFARHWRGEYSLARTWWVNDTLIWGLGINLIMAVLLGVVIFVFREQTALRVIVGLGELALYVAAYVWALVGTWRAAVKYKGPRIWSIWARVGMSLGVLVSIMNVLGAIGLIIQPFE